VVAILVGAFFLNVIIQTIGLTQQLSKLITEWQLSPVQILGAVIVLYLILGTFMEELSMMISTIPITTPLMVQAGYDPVWYGILLVLLIQTAMISPPFGINLFVIHGIRGRGKLSDVEKGSAPFVAALLAMIAMICIWPDIVMIAVRWFG
jgi:TRAP-type C4-dicarboxylate transport system permease large subunit